MIPSQETLRFIIALDDWSAIFWFEADAEEVSSIGRHTHQCLGLSSGNVAERRDDRSSWSCSSCGTSICDRGPSSRRLLARSFVGDV